jgi:hypothetical protein
VSFASKIYLAFDRCDMPLDIGYLFLPLEIESLTIADRFLTRARDSGITVARMVCDEDQVVIDIGEDLEDYLFIDRGGPRAWSWPAFKLDDKNWRELVCGLSEG